jgi:hypothetical protein
MCCYPAGQPVIGETLNIGMPTGSMFFLLYIFGPENIAPWGTKWKDRGQRKVDLRMMERKSGFIATRRWRAFSIEL